MKNLMRILHILAVCLFIIGGCNNELLAQEPHNLYSFTLKNINNQLSLSNPKLLTGYNLERYNNQPHFIKSRVLFLSSMMPQNPTTDIYSLDLFTKKKYQVIKTPEAEYSPQLRPGTNHFTCVRVESDGKTQRLWEFPSNHSTQGKALFPEVKNVGYYYWMNEHEVMMFLVGEPHSLVKGDTRDESIQQVTSNIGRGMGETMDGDFLYIQKLSEKTWYIKQLDIETLKSNIVIETLEGSEDFTVMSNGHLLMAKQSTIYTFDPKGTKEWTAVADLGKFGLKKITRLAYNQDRVLVVVD